MTGRINSSMLPPRNNHVPAVVVDSPKNRMLPAMTALRCGDEGLAADEERVAIGAVFGVSDQHETIVSDTANRDVDGAGSRSEVTTVADVHTCCLHPPPTTSPSRHPSDDPKCGPHLRQHHHDPRMPRWPRANRPVCTFTRRPRSNGLCRIFSFLGLIRGRPRPVMTVLGVIHASSFSGDVRCAHRHPSSDRPARRCGRARVKG